MKHRHRFYDAIRGVLRDWGPRYADHLGISLRDAQEYVLWNFAVPLAVEYSGYQPRPGETHEDVLRGILHRDGVAEGPNATPVEIGPSQYAPSSTPREDNYTSEFGHLGNAQPMPDGVYASRESEYTSKAQARALELEREMRNSDAALASLSPDELEQGVASDMELETFNGSAAVDLQ